MAEKKEKKIAKLVKMAKMEEGMELELSDFQISGTDANGTMTMADFEILDPDRKIREDYVLKPGFYKITDKSGLIPLDVTPDRYFETESNMEISRHFDVFVNKQDIYEKRGLPKKRSILLHSQPGCHAKGQGVIMYDGSIKRVEDIQVGELLMGPDSTPRKVERLVRGRDQMVKIIPKKGTPFVVNMGHTQPFIISGKAYNNEILNIPISEALKPDYSCSGILARAKIFRSELIDFPKTDMALEMDPYILGVWLGDGTNTKPSITNCDPEVIEAWESYINGLGCTMISQGDGTSQSYYARHENASKINPNPVTKQLREAGLNVSSTQPIDKFIPHKYLASSIEDRRKLLAGLIDTDGHARLSEVEIVTKYEQLCKDILFLARSLGFAAYYKVKKAYATNTVNKTVRDYYRIHIHGDFTDIPTKVPHKTPKTREQIKNPLRTGYKTEVLPEDDYYGFSVDGDHLYLLDDFTVTHNCGKTSNILNFLQKFKSRSDVAVLMAENGDWLNWELVSQMWLDKGKDNTKDRVNLAVLIIEDIGGTELSHRDTSVSSEMLNFLDGNSDVFKIPTLIIGTTNFINLLGSTLCDRPGRFDKIIEVLPPKDSEIKILAEEFLGRPLEKDEENAIFGKKFTPAYCKEIIIRHELYNITIAEAAKELEEQRKKSREQKHGNNKKNTGFGDW